MKFQLLCWTRCELFFSTFLFIYWFTLDLLYLNSSLVVSERLHHSVFHGWFFQQPWEWIMDPRITAETLVFFFPAHLFVCFVFFFKHFFSHRAKWKKKTLCFRNQMNWRIYCIKNDDWIILYIPFHIITKVKGPLTFNLCERKGWFVHAGHFLKHTPYPYKHPTHTHTHIRVMMSEEWREEIRTNRTRRRGDAGNDRDEV